MKHHRPARVGALIQEVLNKIILKEVEASGALLTITSVEVDKKLERAIVYISVLPDEKADAVLKRLARRQPYLQSLLARTLNIRPTPTIMFRRDRGPERAAQIERALMGKDGMVA